LRIDSPAEGIGGLLAICEWKPAADEKLYLSLIAQDITTTKIGFTITTTDTTIRTLLSGSVKTRLERLVDGI